MTPGAVLSSLESRGVCLLLDPSAPSGLRVRAPRGVVTPAVAERIRQAAAIVCGVTRASWWPAIRRRLRQEPVRIGQISAVN